MMSQIRIGALLAVGLLVIVVPVVADHVPVLSEAAKLLPSDGQADARFGFATAIDGDLIVVGAYLKDGSSEDVGSAYVFERSKEGKWVEVAKLVASDGDANDELGRSVGIHKNTVVVGSALDDDLGDNSGSAYVFERSKEGKWVEVAKLVASDGDADDWFGERVAIDGDMIVAGAKEKDDLGSQTGAAYVFERSDDGVWLEKAKLLASGIEQSDLFGRSVAIDRNRIAVGATGDDDGGTSAGAVYLFERSKEGVWEEAAKLSASDGEDFDSFGGVVSLDGSILAVGAVNDDDHALGSGAAYVFERTQVGSWVEVAKLFSAHPQLLENFGWVALSGESLVVGALGFLLPGTADLFVRSRSGEWANGARVLASDGALLDQFGRGGSIDGDTLVVGAFLDDDQGIDSGSAYVFSLLNSILTLQLDPVKVRPGEELVVGLALEHKRPETVIVSFQLSIEDAAGIVVAGRTTLQTTLRQGDVLSQELTATIPVGTPPGTYLAKVDAVGMPPWITGARRTFEILPPMPD